MGMVYAFPLHAALNLHLLAADASAAAAASLALWLANMAYA